MTTLSGQALFAQAISGVTNAYSILSKNGSGGLTLDQIMNPGDDVNTTLLNSTFQQYMMTNFNNLDSDGDGKINADDLNKFTQSIQNEGLTYAQLQQLCASGTGDSSLLSTVLSNFTQIDKNGDGKVSEAEIKAYSIEAERAEKYDQMMCFNPNSFSVFYGTDEATSSYKNSTVLDYKYLPKTSSSD